MARDNLPQHDHSGTGNGGNQLTPERVDATEAITVETQFGTKSLSGVTDELQKSTSAPSDTDSLWIDTSISPQVLKIYDPGNSEWRKVAIVTWDEVTNKPQNYVRPVMGEYTFPKQTFDFGLVSDGSSVSDSFTVTPEKGNNSVTYAPSKDIEGEYADINNSGGSLNVTFDLVELTDRAGTVHDYTSSPPFAKESLQEVTDVNIDITQLYVEFTATNPADDGDSFDGELIFRNMAVRPPYITSDPNIGL